MGYEALSGFQGVEVSGEPGVTGDDFREVQFMFNFVGGTDEAAIGPGVGFLYEEGPGEAGAVYVTFGLTVVGR